MRERSVGQDCEILCINREEDVLHSVAIDDAGNPLLTADALDVSLPTGSAELTLEIDMFHNC